MTTTITEAATATAITALPLTAPDKFLRVNSKRTAVSPLPRLQPTRKSVFADLFSSNFPKHNLVFSPSPISQDRVDGLKLKYEHSDFPEAYKLKELNYILGEYHILPSDYTFYGDKSTASEAGAELIENDDFGRKFLRVWYGNGDICEENGLNRVVEVQFTCCEHDHIVSVSEITMCQYIMKIHTQHACHPIFGGSNSGSTVDSKLITCAPVLSPVEYSKFKKNHEESINLSLKSIYSSRDECDGDVSCIFETHKFHLMNNVYEDSENFRNNKIKTIDRVDLLRGANSAGIHPQQHNVEQDAFDAEWLDIYDPIPIEAEEMNQVLNAANFILFGNWDHNVGVSPPPIPQHPDSQTQGVAEKEEDGGQNNVAYGEIFVDDNQVMSKEEVISLLKANLQATRIELWRKLVAKKMEENKSIVGDENGTSFEGENDLLVVNLWAAVIDEALVIHGDLITAEMFQSLKTSFSSKKITTSPSRVNDRSPILKNMNDRSGAITSSQPEIYGFSSSQSLSSLHSSSSGAKLGSLLEMSPSATWGFLEKFDTSTNSFVVQFFLFSPIDGILYAFPHKAVDAVSLSEIRITYCSVYQNTREEDSYVLMIHGYNPYSHHMRKWMLKCKSELSMNVWLTCISRYLASTGSLTHGRANRDFVAAPNVPNYSHSYPGGNGYVAPPRSTSSFRGRSSQPSARISGSSQQTYLPREGSKLMPSPSLLSSAMGVEQQVPNRRDTVNLSAPKDETKIAVDGGLTPVSVDYEQISGVDKEVLIPTILCHAARNGDVEALTNVAKQYGDMLSIGDYDGRTPLHIAVCENQVGAVETLLQYGASFSERDRFGHSPFFDSVKNNFVEVAELLKTAGAKFTAEELEELTILGSKAASENNVALVKLMFELGVDLNSPGLDGRTAVHMAVTGKSLAVLEFFVECWKLKPENLPEIKLDAKDRYKRAPLDDARALDWKEGVECLEACLQTTKTEADYSSMFGSKEVMIPTILCHAARSGDVKTLTEMGKQYPELVSLGDYDGRTPLHIAVCENQFAAVEALLFCGASIHSCDRFGHSPLFDAVKHIFVEVAHLLNDAGSKFTHDELVEIAALLSRAAFDGNLTLVKLIADIGVDLNACGSDGRTALHMTVDFNVKDSYGRTPLDDARALGWDEGIECIETLAKA
ncbi:hypothetical protein HK100_000876 [Physocladia obscura]|uniref:MRH domain-containing protein n=1 Tax=Physocladia obscura TaxID=109957 RepID=A0AAD5XJS9_9FUNG|nr:hypothetical protein HK100_000876 [Physocladia obscura]